MTDTDDEILSRLLTEHLPPIPPRFAEPPVLGLRTAREHNRQRRSTLAFAAAIVTVSFLGAGSVVVWQAVNAGQALVQTEIPAGGDADLGGTGAASPPGGQQFAVEPIAHVDLAPDGRTLIVSYLTGAPACNAARLDHTENATTVVLTLVRWNPNPTADCPAYGITGSSKVTLAAPLGARPVLDGANHNRELSVRNQAERRRPHSYPPGCEVVSLPGVAGWETGCAGGGYTLRYSQARPGEAPVPLGETRTVLGHPTVHHQPATLELWTTPPKIDPSTGKPYTDPTGKPYQPQRTIALVWTEAGYRFGVAARPDTDDAYDQNALIHVAEQVADSVR